MKIRTEFFSFRNRVVVIVVGVTLGALSLLYTNDMARRLKEKEQHDVALWAHAMERVTRDVLGGSIQDPFVADIMSNGNNIPFIITNENLEVINSHLIPEKIINHPGRLRKQIDKFSVDNPPIPVKFFWSSQHYHIIFYGKSALLKSLYYFPTCSSSSSRPSSHWDSSPSARRSTTSRTASGSDWPRRPPTSWEPRPRRCWDGSNTCVRRMWTRRPSRR